MDKVLKFLRKLTKSQREKLDVLIVKIISWDIENLDISKISWHDDLYRIRSWNIRIIFREEWEHNNIINIDRR